MSQRQRSYGERERFKAVLAEGEVPEFEIEGYNGKPVIWRWGRMSYRGERFVPVRYNKTKERWEPVKYRGEEISADTKAGAISWMKRVDGQVADKEAKRKSKAEVRKVTAEPAYISGNPPRPVTVTGYDLRMGSRDYGKEKTKSEYVLVTEAGGDKGSVKVSELLRVLDRDEILDVATVVAEAEAAEKAYEEDDRARALATKVSAEVDALDCHDCHYDTERDDFYTEAFGVEHRAESLSDMEQVIEHQQVLARGKYFIPESGKGWALPKEGATVQPISKWKPSSGLRRTVPTLVFETRSEAQAWLDRYKAKEEALAARQEVEDYYRLDPSDLGELA